jgi:SAM-dependent methyltransferase
VDDDELLAEQRRYYEDRAPVYEDLWFRRGDWAGHDPEELARWSAETGALEAWTAGLPVGDCAVLELACGSGLWTRILEPRAGRYVAVDASTSMLALNRERLTASKVEYRRADLFAFDPGEQFDVVFAGFWLSHVPPSRWGPHLEDIRSWLVPEGWFAFVDDRAAPDRPRPSDRVAAGPDHAHRRRLPDGRDYTIVKRFFSPETLTAALAAEGFDPEVGGTPEHFLHGTAHADPAAPGTARLCRKGIPSDGTAG